VLEKRLFSSLNALVFDNMNKREVGATTEKLIAFESRYLPRHAGQFARDCNLDERELHKRDRYELYDKFRENTKKTFHSFCRRWVEFCERNEYDLLDTSAKTGGEFLEAERLRHKNPGKNVEIAFTQFRKLCTIRGCPKFSESEHRFLHAVVSMAKCDSAQAERSRPVDENKRQMDRNIITSADLQEMLRVCSDMPDRSTATRAKALILTNIQTGESFVLRSHPHSIQNHSLHGASYFSLLSLSQRILKPLDVTACCPSLMGYLTDHWD